MGLVDLKFYLILDEYKFDVVSGCIDVVIDDVVVFFDWFVIDDGVCCKILGILMLDLVINGEGVGIVICKDDGELKDMFNEVIVVIIVSGKYKEINDKYFIFDVYGG